MSQSNIITTKPHGLSASYAPISTAYLMDSLREQLVARGLGYELTTLSSKARGKGWVQATITDMDMQVHGDMVKPTILLRNSTDGTSACQIHVGLLRLVCANGLIAGDSVYSDRIIHRVTKDDKVGTFLRELPSKLGYAIQFICSGGYTQRVEELTSMTLDSEQMRLIIDSLRGDVVISEQLQEAAKYRVYRPRRAEDTGMTLWTLYNILNEELRRSSRSATRIAERNVRLLDQVRETALVVAA